VRHVMLVVHNEDVEDDLVIRDGDGTPGGRVPKANPALRGVGGFGAEDRGMWTQDPALGMELAGASSSTR
jgi:hypothetical protein